MDEREQAQRWAAAWQRAAPALESMRREAIRRADTPQAMAALAGLFRAAVRHHKPRPESGLVEQQRWFRKMRQATP